MLFKLCFASIIRMTLCNVNECELIWLMHKTTYLINLNVIE